VPDIESINTALLTHSALLNMHSNPVLPVGKGEGCARPDLITQNNMSTGGQEHFITRILRTGQSTVPLIEVTDANTTQNFNNSDNSLLYQTPPSSPNAKSEQEDVYVTPPPSPPVAGASLGSSIATAPYTSTLSDVFTAQVPDIPVPSVDPGRVLMTSAGLGPARAGPSDNLGVDFIQINCGKRISAMALLETNVKNKIALIQEPYTSINGCTLLHKRDFFSSGTTPQVATDPNTLWTSLRTRAAIYAPGRSDVFPVYRFMTRDIATVTVQLGFISSVYMDITKSVRSPERLALLDF
jgi:hypothetical protein